VRAPAGSRRASCDDVTAAMGSLQVLRADGGGWKVGISLTGWRGLAVSRYVLAPCRCVVCLGAGGRVGVINWAEGGVGYGLRAAGVGVQACTGSETVERSRCCCLQARERRKSGFSRVSGRIVACGAAMMLKI